MINNNKGLTLIELLITVFITGIAMAAVYTTYINLYSGYKKETKITETQLETLISTEILRTDLQTAGFGIADNETDSGGADIYPYVWDNVAGTFTIYTTYERSDPKTHGWALLACEDNSTSHTCEMREDYRNVDNYTGLKVISAATNNELDNVTMGSPGSDDLYALGFPYDSSAAEKFKTIQYRLDTDCDGDGNADVGERCDAGVQALCRNGSVVVDCVSNISSYFGYESGGSIVYTDNIAASDIMDTKRIVLYLLVQEGQIDNDYNFGLDNVTFTRDFSISGSNTETMQLIGSSSKHKYRWRVHTVEARTVNIR